ncbi:replication-relaxation family protein [Streptomyces sp. NPDC050704]|uniref:replication-relaxation family protein n=1 Tax=Streptomyces sp. NPDC050704 TaxID=3157219 RepID=UPI003416F42F
MITNPTPQRSLRGHHPRRLSGRVAATGEQIARLAPRLTPRDRWLTHMLYEHKVLTTDQITELAWPTTRAANFRLLQLYKWRILDRFQPFTTYGSAPMHYVLDVAGAAVLVREHGLEISDLGYRHEQAIGIAHALRLAHTTGTNGFFTALTAHSRRPDARGRLTAWWSEARCHRHFGDIVRPDAYGRWRQPTGEFEWFLEYDCGTERPADRVGAKLAAYTKLADHTGIATPVLVWTPTAHREARVRRALTEAHAALADPRSVPVATTSAEHMADAGLHDPSSAYWLPLDLSEAREQRLRLADLGTVWPHLPPLSGTPDDGTAATATAYNRLPPPTPRPPNSRGTHGRR